MRTLRWAPGSRKRIAEAGAEPEPPEADAEPQACGRLAGKAARMSRSAAETREHVLGVAHELFYWQGIRATGVDQVAAEAGVAPTTLYRLFASKDDLIAASVARASGLYREWFDAAAAAGGGDPPDH